MWAKQVAMVDSIRKTQGFYLHIYKIEDKTWVGLYNDRCFVSCLIPLREFFPCLDFPSEPSLWTAAYRIHHMCLRSAVSEGAHLRNDNLKSNSEPSSLSQRSHDGVKGLHMCQCRRVTTMVATLGGQEIQVVDTSYEPLPVRPLLPGKQKNK